MPNLFEQHKAGRKVWIGLHVGGAQPGVTGQASPHCTLIHLGAVGSTQLVDAAIDVCRRVARDVAPIEARIGGVARFSGSADGDHVVLLLQSLKIRSLRGQVAANLHLTLSASLSVLLGGFDYTPHMTVSRVPADAPVSLTRHSGDLTLDHIGVTCGDAHLRWPLIG